jgi:hypothetical protein
LHFFHFQSVELGIIQQTILEVKLKNHLVGHGKVDIGKVTFGKPNTTQRNIIDFSVFKIAIKEITIHKSDRLKGTIGEIDVIKRTIVKLFELGIDVIKNFVSEFLIGYII